MVFFFCCYLFKNEIVKKINELQAKATVASIVQTFW